MTDRITGGRYAGYRMTPADHIKAAEDLLAQAQAEAAKRVVDWNGTRAAQLVRMAEIHVQIAQAQMTGQARA